MRPPIRKVCGGCLRSVEVPSPLTQNDNSPPSSGDCPHCGEPIDSRSDCPVVFHNDSDRTAAGGYRPFDRDDSDSTIDWTETWNRGSMGSIGRFQLRERLGEGGFGQVFLAFDPRLDRDVAIKILRQPDPNERVMQRFFREARAAARLDHPNIVAVYDAGSENGRCWIAYQYVRGRPLWWYRTHQSLDFKSSARIIRDLADALNHAHGHGVLHRDIKPANVIMDERGQPRLTDFGLARRADLDSSLTHDGAMVGTPAYMSPEQARGQSRNVDDRSDIYSLGVMFHELLHGSLPSNRADSNSSATEESPRSKPRLSGLRILRGVKGNPPVPPPLQRICERSLALAPEERYPDARTLVEDLDRWLNRSASRSGLVRPGRRIASVLVVTVTIALLGLGVSSIFRPSLKQSGSVEGASNDIQRQSPLSPPPTIPPTILPISTSQATTPEADSDKQAENPNKASLVIGNSAKRKLYHTPNSYCVAAMSESNRQEFKSAAIAENNGYLACSKCFGNQESRD